jgi:uncharacterized coiled-coil DUF342 family protein
MAEEEKTQVQRDIDKLDAKIEELQQDGSDLYAAAITALTDERDELVAKVKEESEDAADSVQDANQKFLDKYGMYILNGAEVVALVAIIYRLFVF